MEDIKICTERTLPNQSIPRKGLHMSMNQFNKNKAVFLTSKLWPPGSTIRIGFMDQGTNVRRDSLAYIQQQNMPYDPLQEVIGDLTPQEAVKLIVKERFQKFLGLNFEFVPINQAQIRISFDKPGAFSNIGTDCIRVPMGQETMNFGWLNVQVVLHEFGHALGMIHEHQNPRGESIQWNKQRLYEWAARPPNEWNKEKTDQNIIHKYDENITNGSTYDPESIMLYYFPAFLTINNKGTKANQRLSKEDVLYLAKQYPNGEMNPSEFYKWAYGEFINGEEDKSIIDDEEEHKVGILIFNGEDKTYLYRIFFIICIVIAILIFKIYNRRKY